MRAGTGGSSILVRHTKSIPEEGDFGARLTPRSQEQGW
jgi:hypothetical protein